MKTKPHISKKIKKEHGNVRRQGALFRRIYRTKKLSPEKSKPQNLGMDSLYANNSSESKTGSIWKNAREYWKKFSLFGFILKFTLYSFLLVIVLFSAGYGAVVYFADNTVIKSLVANIIKEQTGGDLEIGEVDFHVNTGLSFKKLKFFPPKISPSWQLNQGYELASEAFVAMEEVNVHYDLLAAAFGSIKITALQLVRPEFKLIQKDKNFNFSGIINYRNKVFPNKTDRNKGLQGPIVDDFTLIPVHPKYFYFPLTLDIKNFGIQNMKIQYTKKGQEKTELEAFLKGLNLDIAIFAHGRSSLLEAKLDSLENEDLSLSISRKRNKDSELGKFKSIALKNNLNFRLALKDLSQFHVDLNYKIESIKGALEQVSGLNAQLALKTALTSDLRGVQIEEFLFNISNILNSRLQGKISFLDNSFKKFMLDLKSNFFVSLHKIRLLLPELTKTIDFGGQLELAALDIAGPLDLEKLSQFDQAELPMTSAQVRFQRIFFSDKNKGFYLQPSDGQLSLAVAPSLQGSGYQLDTFSQIQSEGLSVEQKSKTGRNRVSLEEIYLKTLVKADYPSMQLPVVKMSLEVPHIVLNTNEKKTLDVPLKIESSGSFSADVTEAALALRADIGEIAVLSSIADCQNSCEKIRFNTHLNMNSLKNLHRIAQPFAELFGLSRKFPQHLSGQLGLQTDITAQIPSIKNLDVFKVVNQGKIKFHSQVFLEKLNMKLPLYQVNLENFEGRGIFSGDVHEQKFSFDQSLQNLSLVVPSKRTQVEKNVELGRFNFNTEVKNTLNLPIPKNTSVNELFAHLATNIKTDLFLGSLEAKFLTPEALKNFEIDFNLFQDMGKKIELKYVNTRVPGLGIEFSSDAKMSLKQGFPAKIEPFDIASNIMVKFNQSGRENIPVPIRTSGQFVLKTSIMTPDMNRIMIDGNADFEHFKVDLFSQKDNKKILEIDNVVGAFPFKQKISLTPHLAKKRFQGRNKAPVIQDGIEAGQKSKIDKKVIRDLDQVIDEYYAKLADQSESDSMAMAIADYGSMRPFYPLKKPIHIKKLELANLLLEDIEFDLELRQDWFSLNQFLTRFLGGKIQGAIQVFFEPMPFPHSLKIALHLTRLNTHKLLDRFPELQKKATASLFATNPYVDAAIHINYHLKNKDISGGINFSSIGKEQLRMILFYLDPEEKDKSISQIKTALNFGDVDSVVVPIKNGEIDVDVRLSLLGIQLPIPKITRFPISTLIGNMVGESDKKHEKKQFSQN